MTEIFNFLIGVACFILISAIMAYTQRDPNDTP